MMKLSVSRKCFPLEECYFLSAYSCQWAMSDDNSENGIMDTDLKRMSVNHRVMMVISCELYRQVKVNRCPVLCRQSDMCFCLSMTSKYGEV